MTDSRPTENTNNNTDANAESSGIFTSLRTLFGVKTGETSLRESLEEAIVEHDEGSGGESLGDKEREMLFNVLEYGALRVGDVMVPRADIISVPNDISFPDLMKVFAEAAHSRMPVYRETLDDVVGMVHVKDTLKVVVEGKNSDAFSLSSIRRPVLYVPASMRVIDLLGKMSASRTHMAVVVDEYGGTDGLVTVEDMVEEIVGEIDDEHDEIEAPDLVPLPEGRYDADARIDVEELEEALGVELTPEERGEDVDTLGGLVFLLGDRVPDIGEIIEHETGYKFEVLDADPRRIKKIRIHPPGRRKAAAKPPASKVENSVHNATSTETPKSEKSE
ncbi:hemolysin family protein [Kordiimonas aquimaris]|uniref:hemolysin family protein n=1 Tax=Kordiimonas aquimaris TaxID=707591 RepID=UPI0021D1819B|nr:hemolysin family protein [Kordiimonas aquimaris]